MYENGRGVDEDDEQAFEWYEAAAKQGNAQAQFNLGLMYENGRGVDEDDGQAFEWYEAAAKQGHARAQYYLGLMYDNGQGVAKDDKKAFEWYEAAAKQGHARAQYYLGWMYANGQGVAKDNKKAFEWYEAAVKQGHAEAQCNLGSMYEEGRGVKQDIEKAFKYYQLSAEQGNCVGLFNLGVLYEQKNNLIEAEKCYTKATAKKGELSDNYDYWEKSINVSTNPLSRAALLFDLGVVYARGLDISQDKIKAVNFFTRALEEGHSSAQKQLDVLKESTSSEDRKETEDHRHSNLTWKYDETQRFVIDTNQDRNYCEVAIKKEDIDEAAVEVIASESTNEDEQLKRRRLIY